MFTARVMLIVLALIQSASVASSLNGADASLPGAEARLGWGGGYSSGAWSLLHLRVTGGDAYRLNLATQTGTLRSGLQPLTATLTVSAGAGVREQRLWLPLFTKRPVKLTLSSNTGVNSATIQPLSANAVIAEPMDSPAAYLGQPRVTGSLEPQSALIALAGGAVLTNANGLERLPSGALGLGELRRTAATTRVDQLGLQQIALSIARVAQPPPRQSEGLAWWCAAAFVVTLGAYSARRLEGRVAVWGAGLMLMIGATGWAALQARDGGGGSADTNVAQTVLIGAGGWGVQMRTTSVFNANAGSLNLPSGVQLLSPADAHYSQTATLIQAGAWKSVSYWSAPTAARVPLRVNNNELENAGTEPLTDVYVIGTGSLEPINAAAKRSFTTSSGSRIEDGFSSYGSSGYGSSGYGSLIRQLPSGSALARRGQTLVIALPERSEPR